MDKKTIQRNRMMGYFIEATNKLIEEEGFDNVAIRKVADLAGYNSATIYNYFEDLDHLLFFSSMKYLKEYAFDIPKYTKGSKNSLDKFLRIWKCFCTHSFKRPKIYYTIFFDKYSDSINDAVRKYYSIFPEELGDQAPDVLPMLLEKNIYARDMAVLKNCADEGFISHDDLLEINEMILLIYQGMLIRVLHNQVNYSIEEAVDKTLNYIRKVFVSYGADIEKA